ncbi:glycosyltransferase family 2 protein [Streptomyces lavendulae]|uniref:glycosyltransferase family 2 protein n=1 Tax=Streptomyces lavendulae TaxID=1914 RepID=UPI0033FA64E6
MKVLLLVPVYNEEGAIESVINGVRRAFPGIDILVIDDGSTDASPHLLRQRSDLVTLRHAVNFGYGRALIAGFEYAIRRGYDITITMDCDGQHSPTDLRRFMAAACRADIVSGSRYLGAARGDVAPIDRQRLNREFTRRIREVAGLRITDAWCGFKLYHLRVLRAFELTEDGYGMPLQIWIQAAYHRFCVREVAIARVYDNPNRTFGGGLDNVEQRRSYYLRVLENEVERWLPEKLSLFRVAS